MKSMRLHIIFGLLIVFINNISYICPHGYAIKSFASLSYNPCFDNHLEYIDKDIDSYAYNKISGNISNTTNGSDTDLHSNSNNKNNSFESTIEPNTSAIESLRY